MQDIVDALYIAGRTGDRDQLDEALWSREGMYSSGLGYGFATPHSKSGALTAHSIGILQGNRPIDWGWVDKEEVRMIILIAMRETEDGNRHMQVFSRLARMMMNEEFRACLLAIESAREMVAYLAQQLMIPAPPETA
jgi:multiphosphoryl transfer protein